MSEFLRRTWAEIHLDRLRDNASAIRNHLSAGCRLMAVVKADAYGHGAVQSAHALESNGVDWFGVSNLDEAEELRRSGITAPILVISYTPSSQIERLAANDITQTVVSAQHAKELSDAAVAADVSLRVHFKLDTGMSRVGFGCSRQEDCDRAVEELVAAADLPGLFPEGIFTHFASADEEQDDGFTEQQFERFSYVVTQLENKGVHFSLRHCCNSAALLRFPHMHLDMVRAGVIMYGLMPSDWMGTYLPALRPVMEIKTTVSMVKTVPAGALVSYGRTYTAQRDTCIATVPIGYADGYLRLLSDKASMLVNGARAPQIGRICMDQCMLDVTDIEGVQQGSVVTIFGCDGDACVTVGELAALCGTIHYELVCLLNRRVPRVYYDGQQRVAMVNYLL